MLPYPLARPVEAVGADEADGEEVVGGAEAARGEVALVFGFGSAFVSCGWGGIVCLCVCGGKGNLVLDGLVAAGWGQVLSHLLCLVEALGKRMLGGCDQVL